MKTPMMECAMNKSSALLLAALGMVLQNAGPVQSAGSPVNIPEQRHGEIGQGVVCDTIQHVQRFVMLRGGGEEAGEALETVNYEANDEAACQFAYVLYTDDQTVGQLAVKARLFTIIQVTVRALGNGSAWVPTPPRVLYTVKVEKGQIV
jgi:hypothetical protein